MIYITSSNFVTISQINYWDQVNSLKNFQKFWNGPHCRNKSDSYPLLNVAVCWKSSNTEACANKLTQILANNNKGRGVGITTYVRFCSIGYLEKRKIFVVSWTTQQLTNFNPLIFAKSTEDTRFSGKCYFYWN